MNSNLLKLLFSSALLVASSAGHAVTVVDDFEDGELAGWFQSIRDRATPGEGLYIESEADGNQYMVIESFGPRSGRHPDPGSKLNAYAGPQWTGDALDEQVVLFADMKNMGAEDLPMYMAFTDRNGFTAYYSSEVIVPATGEWVQVAFNLNEDDFTATALYTDFFPDPESFEFGAEDVTLMGFYSAEDGVHPHKQIAKIGIDNIGVSGTSLSQVPVPAAVWFFLSGLMGLKVVSRRK